MESSSDLAGLLQAIAAAGLTPRLALCVSPADASIRYWQASLHNDGRGADFHYASATHRECPYAAMAEAYERFQAPRVVRTYEPPAVRTHVKLTTLEDLGL